MIRSWSSSRSTPPTQTASGRQRRRTRPGRALRALLASALVVGTLVLAAPVDAAFPGRDGLVAFGQVQANRSQFQIPLFTMDPDGSSVRQLTKPGWGFADGDPVWSPDGTRVVFKRDDFAANNSDLWVVNADGSGLRQLTHCAAVDNCGGYFDPTWAADGSTIFFAYCCVKGNGGDLVNIFSMNADGTGLRRVTTNDDVDCGDNGPTASPDGRWIAFSRSVGVPSNKGQCVTALFLVHPNGTGLHQITSYDLQVDEKDWSPDGSRITFVSHEGSDAGPFRADLFSVAPDGSQLTQLTHTTPGQTFAFKPAWAPAGDRIMFDFFPGPSGSTDMFTMRPDGSDVRLVASTPADESGVSWGTAPLR